MIYNEQKVEVQRGTIRVFLMLAILSIYSLGLAYAVFVGAGGASQTVGGSGTTGPSGAGGSGIVIIRYAIR